MNSENNMSYFQRSFLTKRVILAVLSLVALIGLTACTDTVPNPSLPVVEPPQPPMVKPEPPVENPVIVSRAFSVDELA